jgi:electron transfer flavoprotein alpha subunit
VKAIIFVTVSAKNRGNEIEVLTEFARPLTGDGARTEIFDADICDCFYPQNAVCALEALCKKYDGGATVLSVGGFVANQISARLAYRFKTECVTNVRGVVKEGDGLCVVRKACGSNVDMTLRLDAFPRIMTVAPPPDGTAGTALIAGVGLGGKSFGRVSALADKIGGAAFLTRAAAIEAGDASRIVGQSGAAIAPRLCVALGVSGASAFLAGVEGAETLAAVNVDADAPIFRRADIGIVADAKEVLTELERLWK